MRKDIKAVFHNLNEASPEIQMKMGRQQIKRG